MFSKRLLSFTAVPTLAAALAIVGCNRATDNSAASTPTRVAQSTTGPTVSIDNFSFNPPTLTIPVGATVTWTNHDDVPHTVTANDKAFNSKTMDTDEHFAHQFTAPGQYPYFCAVHTHMTGQVVVVK